MRRDTMDEKYSDCKFWKAAEVERIYREFIASLHVRTIVRAKEKLEELDILIPLGEGMFLESYFKVWLDVLQRSAVELPEITDYCLCNIFDSWAAHLEIVDDLPEATLTGIASILRDTKLELLEYHSDANEIIVNLNRVADRYAEIANCNNAKSAETDFYRVANAKTWSDLTLVEYG